MKKIIKVLLMTIILLPTIVLADMGAPEVIPYKASISNPEGAKYYTRNWNEQTRKSELQEIGTLEFGQEIKITFEAEEESGFFEINKEGYYIDLKDITPINDAVDFSNKRIRESDITGTVLSEKGVIIYNGPAYGYKKTEVIIPKGTKLDFSYETEPWYYTEYKGTKGWICILNGVVGFKNYTDEVITSSDTDITDVMQYTIMRENKDYKTIGTIKANTIIKKDNIFGLDAWSKGYLYINHNNISGYIRSDNIIPKCSTKCDVEIQEGFNSIYESINNDEIGTIEEKNTISSKIIDSIPTGTQIKLLYLGGGDYACNYLGYVEYKGKKGWIEIPQKYFYEIEENKAETITITTVPITTKVVKNKSKTPSEYVLIYVFIAIILSLTALVTIILINKKKSKKNIIDKDYIENNQDNSNIDK